MAFNLLNEQNFNWTQYKLNKFQISMASTCERGANEEGMKDKRLEWGGRGRVGSFGIRAKHEYNRNSGMAILKFKRRFSV